jgi:hypothetical protein
MRKRNPGESLAMFLVDRTFPGMTEELLAEVHRLLDEAARRMSTTGGPVRHLRCLYMPEDNRCICLFEGRDFASVRKVNEIAQVPFLRISSAIEFWASGVAEEEARVRAGEERSSHDNT